MTSAALGIIVSAFALAFTTHLANAPVPPSSVAEVQRMSMDLYPLIGGAFACCAVFALYDRRKETPLQIVGRALFGLMAAFFAPWLWTLLPDTWHITDYRGLTCIGAVAAVLGFILSKTTIERLFTKAPEFSDEIVSRVGSSLEKKPKD